MPVLNTNTPPIGGWSNRGCVFVNLKEPAAGTTLTSQTGNEDANGANVEKYQGEIVLLQGGSSDYGWRSTVNIFVVSANSILVERIVSDQLVQSALLTKTADIQLGNTVYKQFTGPTQGPGAGHPSSIMFQ